MIEVTGIAKSFTLHNQDSISITVLANASLSVQAGECVALTGRSGVGKSSLLRMIYGNYLSKTGSILVDGMDVVGASPRDIATLRKTTLGYVSQFLRVVPRVPVVDIVAEPLLAIERDADEARAKARHLLRRVNIPSRLWSLSPTTFSGGEQQRVNLARGFIHDYPALLLDEPTASLDGANRDTVLTLIKEAKARGAAIIGIFHDEAARHRVCDREIDVASFAASAAPS